MEVLKAQVEKLRLRAIEFAGTKHMPPTALNTN